MPETRLSSVRGGDGLDLATYEAGNPNGPAILFLHGFSQSALCWQGQMKDTGLSATFRLVACDLRGHGASSRPEGPAFYAEDRLFAEYTAAVFAALGPTRPVLARWSYAGRVIGDYLRAFGSDGIARINTVCARTNSDLAFSGPGNQHLRAMCRGDLAAEIAAAPGVSVCLLRPPAAARGQGPRAGLHDAGAA